MATTNLKSKLSECVAFAQELEKKISNFRDEEFQKKLESVINDLEQLTLTVSRLDMFSANESLEEMPTSSMRYLMLPGLLAVCTDKLKSDDRKATLECVEVYTKDFVTRLKNYGVLPSSSRHFNVTEHAESLATSPDRNASAEEYLKHATKIRDEKVRLYRQQKELGEQYEAFKVRMQDCNDEEQEREFYLLELNYWACKLFEMFTLIQREKPILEQLAKIKSGEIEEDSAQTRPPPFKPIILTRCKLTKEVFGLGYPSVPTVSLDEFYDKQTQEGNLHILSDKNEPVYDAEASASQKEEHRDRDDASLVQSERDFDEYKDDHRTGWGNTYNKG